MSTDSKPWDEELVQGRTYPIEVNDVPWLVHVVEKARDTDNTPLAVTFDVLKPADLPDQNPEHYLNVTFKWDGCAEFQFTDLHLCGKDGIARHGFLLNALHNLAGRALGGELDA